MITMLFFLLVSSIPTVLWLILGLLGVGLFLLSGVLEFHTPRPYSFLIKPVAAMLTVLGIFMYGGAVINQHYIKEMRNLKSASKQAAILSKEANKEISQQLEIQTQVIQQREIVYRDRIVEIAAEIDAKCELDPAVVAIHNQAATYPNSEGDSQ
jgi:hypothetical protein